MDACHANYCIWEHNDADDEDWCFSPVSRSNPHARCKDLPEDQLTEKLANLTLVDESPPIVEEHICCEGCVYDGECEELDPEDRCDCCNGNCPCCAGVCSLID